MERAMLNRRGITSISIESARSITHKPLNLLLFQDTDYNYLNEHSQYHQYKFNIIANDLNGNTISQPIGHIKCTIIRSQEDLELAGFTFSTFMQAHSMKYDLIAKTSCYVETGTLKVEICDNYKENIMILDEIYISPMYQELGIGSFIVSNIQHIISNLLIVSISTVLVYVCPNITLNCNLNASICKSNILRWIYFYSSCGYMKTTDSSLTLFKKV